MSERILLVDVDSKIANLALMKLSAYHKARGDEVHLTRRGSPPLEWGPCRSTKGFHWEPTEEFWPDGRRRYVKITDRCPCPAFVAREDPLAYPATDVPFTDRSPQEARP